MKSTHNRKIVGLLSRYLFISLLLISNSAFSQKRFKIGATYNFKIAPKPEFEHVLGEQQLDPRVSMAYDIGLHMEYQLAPGHKIISGLRIGKYPLSYAFDIPGDTYLGTFYVPYKWHAKSLMDYTDIPLLYEHSFQKGPNPRTFFHLGIDLKFIQEMRYTYVFIVNNPDSMSETSTAFEARINSNPSLKLHYSIQTGGSYLLSLFRNNDLRLNCTINISTKSMGDGLYAFFNGTDELSYGKYNVEGHYLSFGATYLFWQPKKNKK